MRSSSNPFETRRADASEESADLLYFYYTVFEEKVKTRKRRRKAVFFRLHVRFVSVILFSARGSRESVFSREGGDAP